MAKPRKDDLTGRETMGHDFDGIEELNTPMPRWWLIAFYLTIIWGVGYTIAFPAWPMISGATAGLLGYSTRAEVGAQLAAHDAANADLVEDLLSVDLAAFDPQTDLHRYAVARGASVFRAQCSQCHGSGAAGANGYPNLLDNDWLWGGTLLDVAYSVRHGIRNDTDDDAHWSQMPAFARPFWRLTKSKRWSGLCPHFPMLIGTVRAACCIATIVPRATAIPARVTAAWARPT